MGNVACCLIRTCLTLFLHKRALWEEGNHWKHCTIFFFLAFHQVISLLQISPPWSCTKSISSFFFGHKSISIEHSFFYHKHEHIFAEGIFRIDNIGTLGLYCYLIIKRVSILHNYLLQVNPSWIRKDIDPIHFLFSFLQSLKLYV